MLTPVVELAGATAEDL